MVQREETFRGQRLSKEVRHVLVSLNIRDHQVTGLDKLAHVEVSTVDVLRSRMVFRIICEITQKSTHSHISRKRDKHGRKLEEGIRSQNFKHNGNT